MTITHAKVDEARQNSNLICIISRTMRIPTFKSISYDKKEKKIRKLNFSNAQ